ncbi:MAG: response regulator transcription factor [Campylobacteraceae bacterium]|nr:response regulator transcription factor [Campylobacteraceae bacterium]MBT3881953.1 response regulator transcription factor [Campylobacteraceae bacterium]MBT4178687.1 response regulator transcription factor [Campylobacteraceae bacterium]MBT4572322.1 response regulator transcription factor [Campylobacteraceae bacterium]MBT4708257.1 response regulator transcription factor [Campylobacteraceae bacterium]
MKVLLVEDEEELSSLLKDAIGEYFYSFNVASNGIEGLKQFNNIQADIVITDINMPDMTGLEMSEKLRKDNPDLPIIILSAFSQKEYLLNAIDLSVTKYLIKPFDPDELLEYIVSISNKIGNKEISLVDGFVFNKNTNSLSLNGDFVKITKREAKFLNTLIDISPLILEDNKMKLKLWDDDDITDERVRTFIKRFRQKTSKTLINNIKGQGYQIII